MTAPKPLQEYADAVLAPEYRQPLKTLEEACAVHGWLMDSDPLLCCGARVGIQSFIGSAYFAKCNSCGRFVVDVAGPHFSESGGSVSLPDSKKIDIHTDRRWIAGTHPHVEPVYVEPVPPERREREQVQW